MPHPRDSELVRKTFTIKLKNDKSIPTKDIDLEGEIDHLPSDKGYWVRCWVWISEAEVENYEDPTE